MHNRTNPNSIGEVMAKLKRSSRSSKRHPAETVVTGASADAIEAFAEMQAESRAADAEVLSTPKPWWKRLLRR